LQAWTSACMPSLPARTSLRACFHSARALIRSRHRIPCPLACSRAGTIGSRGAGEQGSRGRLMHAQHSPDLTAAVPGKHACPMLPASHGGPLGWIANGQGAPPACGVLLAPPLLRQGPCPTPRRLSVVRRCATACRARQHSSSMRLEHPGPHQAASRSFLLHTSPRGIFADHNWFPDLSGEAINEGIGLPS
jgi:hypothetical protein